MSGVFLDCTIDTSLPEKGVVEIVKLYVHSGLLGGFDLTLGFITVFNVDIPNSVQMHDISLHRVKFTPFTEQF